MTESAQSFALSGERLYSPSLPLASDCSSFWLMTIAPSGYRCRDTHWVYLLLQGRPRGRLHCGDGAFSGDQSGACSTSRRLDHSGRRQTRVFTSQLGLCPPGCSRHLILTGIGARNLPLDSGHLGVQTRPALHIVSDLFASSGLSGLGDVA